MVSESAIARQLRFESGFWIPESVAFVRTLLSDWVGVRQDFLRRLHAVAIDVVKEINACLLNNDIHSSPLTKYCSP